MTHASRSVEDGDTSDSDTSDGITSKEAAQTKLRLCHGCNKCGVSHDKHTCPTLLER